MNTITIKTHNLTGPALDWAVAKCEGHIHARRVVVDFKYRSGEDPVRWEPVLDTYYSSAYSPSTDWAMGGPIIEREGITVQRVTGALWDAYCQRIHRADGPTPLIAAMRCYVASVLGDTVEIPEELK